MNNQTSYRLFSDNDFQCAACTQVGWRVFFLVWRKTVLMRHIHVSFASWGHKLDQGLEFIMRATKYIIEKSDAKLGFSHLSDLMSVFRSSTTNMFMA